MRPVGTAVGKGGQDADNDGKKTANRHADRTKQSRQEPDSSEESKSETSTEKSGKSLPTMNARQEQKKKDGEVRVATNSTTDQKEKSSAPTVGPSVKREAFQSKAKREKEMGMQGRHRRRDTDLKRDHPELQSLQKAQRKKDWENGPATVDPAKLTEQAKSAVGHLRVQVKVRKDIDVLVKVLNANPWIRSLKLGCNFGGKSGQPGDLNLRLLTMLAARREGAIESPDIADAGLFASILAACKHIEALDLKGCRLTEKDWCTLAEHLNRPSTLQRLEIGGGDLMSTDATRKIVSSIGAGHSSLSEFVADGLYMPSDYLQPLWKSLGSHGKFSLVKLQNISDEDEFIPIQDMGSIFTLCTGNPGLKLLSLAGTPFMRGAAANDGANGAGFAGPGISSEVREFRKHACLRVLDLSHCGLNGSRMGDIAAACDGHASLIEIRIEGNTVMDSDRATFTAATAKNRARLQAQASAVFDLLATHAAGDIDVWPPELSEVLAQNTPAAILADVAAVMNPGVGSTTKPNGPAPTATLSPGNSSGGPSSTPSLNKQ